MNEYILAIETSCDETAAAIVKDGRQLLASIVASQIDSHKRFGGVVPEIASRHHVEEITMVVEEALLYAKLSIKDMTAIAVTEGPGLIGALLVGISAAKAIAFAHQIPLVPVHHLAGHIYANRFQTEFRFPLLALIVSGGHTELVLMKEHGVYEVLGETRDDAVGEAYDKIARMLDFPYPGGPYIDRLATEGTASISLPRALMHDASYDFSFSGLKSAVINLFHNAKQRNETIHAADLAASFQESIVDVLVHKTIRATKQFEVKQVLLAGGVAANRGLRTGLQEAFEPIPSVELVIPPLNLCTDNAAMIAAAGSIAFAQGKRAKLSLNGDSGMELR